MVKTIMPSSKFEFLMEEIKYNLLNSKRYGRLYFNGDEAEFEKWAGDVLSVAIEYALNEVGIEISWELC